MIRRSLRIGVWLGLLAGLVLALTRLLRPRPATTSLDVAPSVPPQPWPPLAVPEPEPVAEPVAEATPAPAAAPTAAPTPPAKPSMPTWIAPNGGVCPTTHPVKAKLKSGIFHQPGGMNYDRTVPDRCYESADAAIADGLRPSKR